MSFIDQMDLSMEEQKVYEMLLSFGNLTSYELTEHGKLSHERVLSALEALSEKGAIGFSKGYVTKYFARVPLDYLGDISQKLADSTKKNISETKEFIQRKKQEFQEQKNSYSDKLSDAIQTRKDNLSSQFDQKSTEINSKIDEQKDMAKNEKETLSNTLLNQYDKFNQSLTQKTTSVLNNASSSLEKTQSGMETIRSNLDERISSDISQIIEKTDINLQKNLNQIETITETIIPEVDDFNDEFVSYLSEIVDATKSKIDVSKTDMREFNKKETDKSLEYTGTVIDNLEKTIDNTSELVKGKMDTLDTNLENLLNQKLETMTQKINETISKLKTQLENTKQELFEELIQQKSIVISSAILEIKDDLAIKFTEFQNNEQQRKNAFLSERDMFSQRLESYYNETLNEFENKVNEIQKLAKERFQSLNSNFVSQYTDVASNLSSSANSFKESFINLANELQNSILDELNTESQLLSEDIQQIKQKISSLINTSEDDISTIYNETKTSIDNHLSSFSTIINNQIKTSVGEMMQVSQALLSLSKTELDKSKELVLNALNEQIDSSLQYMDDAEASLESSAKELIAATSKLGKEFKTIEASVKTQPIPSVETTAIIGLEAVKDHIKRILSNTKSKATLMVPSPNDVPINIIKTLPRTAQVIIVTKVDAEQNRPWLENVFSSQANVQVRTLREGGAGGGIGMEMPALYAVERENEEVLFAAEDETTKEIVGVLSHSTMFAQIISYTMISHYATGASRQLPKTDYQ